MILLSCDVVLVMLYCLEEGMIGICICPFLIFVTDFSFLSESFRYESPYAYTLLHCTKITISSLSTSSTRLVRTSKRHGTGSESNIKNILELELELELEE